MRWRIEKGDVLGWNPSLKKKPIATTANKDIKGALNCKRLYTLLRAIWLVLELPWIADLNKPGMDRLYQILYKAYRAIKNSKETLDDVNCFVRSLINVDDEADATYSESESEDGNEDDLQEEYDDGM